MSDVRIEYVTARDGIQIATHRIGPEDGTPVVLLPGTFSNHTFWLGTRGTGFARTLARLGYDTWTVDPRGHGASQKPTSTDRWNFEDWARHDATAAIEAATRDARGPAFVVGHSAGGAAALAALAAEPELRERVQGIVVIGTPVPWLQPMRGHLARLARRITLGVDRFPARILGLGPEDELPGVMAQWLHWNINGHWKGDDGTDYGARFEEIGMPSLVVAGAGDRIFAPPDACHALFEMIGARDKTFIVCGRRTGFSVDFGHAGLMVDRAARAEIWPMIIDWMARRSAVKGCD